MGDEPNSVSDRFWCAICRKNIRIKLETRPALTLFKNSTVCQDRTELALLIQILITAYVSVLSRSLELTKVEAI